MNTAIHPFRIEISDSQIDDLRARLAATRWPQPVVRDFSHGQAVSLVRELADYWRDGFDWRAQEARLNALPQFTTEIDGQTLHFIHVKSPEAEAFPLILTHGWPSSPAEYLDLIGPLTDLRGHGRDDAPAFDLVIPSVPGMGLSSPLAAAGWDAARTAAAWDTLMKRLGYERYGAQGGDVGALVAREMGILAPEGLAGVHVQQIFAFPAGTPDEMQGLTPFEMAGFERLNYFRKYAGYVDIQSKRPGTLAFGLVDSPAALLAWNAEFVFRLRRRTRRRGRPRPLPHPPVALLVHRHRRAGGRDVLRQRRQRRGLSRPAQSHADGRGRVPRRLPLGPKLRGALAYPAATVDRDATRRSLRQRNGPATGRGRPAPILRRAAGASVPNTPRGSGWKDRSLRRNVRRIRPWWRRSAVSGISRTTVRPPCPTVRGTCCSCAAATVR